MNYISDINLRPTNETYNVVIEICPGTSNKDELIEPNFNALQTVRQVVGLYPFYYGSFPRTLAGDKDPLDFILFTNKPHKQLDIVEVVVIGAVHTIDDGEQDDKIICVEHECGLTNVSKQMKQALKFLHSYKGKNANMKIDNNLVTMDDAEWLIKKAHETYLEKEHCKEELQKKQIRYTSRVSVRR